MDEDWERAVLAVRADTRGFAADVQEMRAELDGTLGPAADRAGRALEAGLARAVRSGKLGFEDLGRVAESVLSQIAASAVRSGVNSILGSVGGLIGLSGLPGRATGGPVAPGGPMWSASAGRNCSCRPLPVRWRLRCHRRRGRCG